MKKQSAGLREEFTTLQDKVTTLQTELTGVRNEVKSLQDENVILKKLVSQKTNIWVYIFGLIGVVLALLFIIGLISKIISF